MKTMRFVFVLIVAALLLAAFAPLPGGGSAATGNTVTLNTPVQSFVEAAMGLPLLSPMTVSASAPLVRLTVNQQELRGGTYACKLVSQTPADWTKMKGRQSFDAKWTLLNTGTAIWSKKIVDYKYISGRKMQTYGDSYDLPISVGVGRRVAVIVDMMAPKYNGTYTWYTTTWGLFTGSKSFCKFTLYIVVNR